MNMSLYEEIGGEGAAKEAQIDSKLSSVFTRE